MSLLKDMRMKRSALERRWWSECKHGAAVRGSGAFSSARLVSQRRWTLKEGSRGYRVVDNCQARSLRWRPHTITQVFPLLCSDEPEHTKTTTKRKCTHFCTPHGKPVNPADLLLTTREWVYFNNTCRNDFRLEALAAPGIIKQFLWQRSEATTYLLSGLSGSWCSSELTAQNPHSFYQTVFISHPKTPMTDL